MAQKPIQLFVPTFRVEECLAEVRECLEKGWTGLGYKTLDFEKAWTSYTGLPHAHFLSSATAGLHLALAMLKERHGWQDGDEIISTPLTFVSSNHAVLYERLAPVFADVDQYLCLDPESVIARITPRTRAVIFVGFGGNCGQLEAMVKLCRERGLKLILDAAHMSGSQLNGRHVGGEGDVSVFSFHAVKNLPTADGGMICFPDEASDAAARQWSWLGIDKDTYARTNGDSTYKWHYQVNRVGFKYHGNSVMAGIGLVSLKYLEADNARRRELAEAYDRHLEGADGIERVPMASGCVPSRHLYQVQVDHRDDVMVALNQASIYPGVHYRDNSHYPMYAGQPSCPRARRASERLISLPLHLQMDEDDVAAVCTALRDAVARN